MTDLAASRLDEIRRMDLRDQMQLAWEMGPLSDIEDIYLDQGCSMASIVKLLKVLEDLRQQKRDLHGTQINRWLGLAKNLPVEKYSSLCPDDAPGDAMPFWPTGCSRLDALTGGGYGMTVISGEPKVGKSLLAMSAAIEAARSGWRVVYLNAELTKASILNRVLAYAKTIDDDLKANLSIHQIEAGFTVDDAMEAIRAQLDLDTMRLLIVQDSINRIVDLSCEDGSEFGYWRTLRMWSELARRTARLSEGLISSIIVSELNKQGRTKGGGLDYAADLVVSIKADSEDDQDLVYMSVPYARSSRGGKVGELMRSWQNGRFS